MQIYLKNLWRVTTSWAYSIMNRCVHELVHHQLPRPRQGHRHLRSRPSRYNRFISTGNSGIVVHVGSDIFYLISLRRYIRSKAVKNRILFVQKDLFSFMRAQLVLSYHKKVTRILGWVFTVIRIRPFRKKTGSDRISISFR